MPVYQHREVTTTAGDLTARTPYSLFGIIIQLTVDLVGYFYMLLKKHVDVRLRVVKFLVAGISESRHRAFCECHFIFVSLFHLQTSTVTHLANNNIWQLTLAMNSSIHPRVPQHNRNVGHFAFESIMHRGDIVLHVGDTSLHV